MTPGQRQWLTRFSQAVGGFPRNYLLLDAETCGLSLSDPIWELGFIVVQDTKPVAKGDVQINISYGKADLGDIKERFEKTRETMLKLGGNWESITWEWLCQHGTTPTEAYAQFHALIKQAIEKGMPIVGHHMIEFDMPRWQRGFVESCGINTLPWREEQVLDTQYLIAGMLQDAPPPSGPQGMGEWNLGMRGKHRTRKYGSSSQEAAMGYCDMTDTHQHRALSDAAQLYQVLEYCRNAAENA